MFKFLKSKKISKYDYNSDYDTDLFIDILNQIKEINNQKTPHPNNWKLRQTRINNYIDLTIANIYTK